RRESPKLHVNPYSCPARARMARASCSSTRCKRLVPKTMKRWPRTGRLPLGLPPHRGRFSAYIRGLLEREAFKTEANRPVKQALGELADVLAIGSNYNPRSLVRFINNLIVDRSIWVALRQEVSTEHAAVARTRGPGPWWSLGGR
ncbi:MAG: hypothetical protein O7C98_05715, partial [Planctomycetota bacterium]|nr:hypothetical protein [Planctomycetota bacterium]